MRKIQQVEFANVGCKKNKLGACEEKSGLSFVKGMRCTMLLNNVFDNGISNEVRFTDVLEKLITGIKVYNFAMEGFGLDQQYLCYQEIDIEFDHNSIIITPAIEAIRKLVNSLQTFKKGSIPL